MTGWIRGRFVGAAAAVLGLAALSVPPVPAQTDADAEPFPEMRPATRAQAVSVLSGGGRLPIDCLTPLIRSDDPSPAAGRALEFLAGPQRIIGERRITLADGTQLRYTTAAGTFDRLNRLDENRDGTPDVIATAAAALGDARALLVDGLGLGDPGPLEIVLGHVGRQVSGYTVVGTDGTNRLMIEASNAGPEAVRRAVVHQFAHAAAAGLPSAWSEALAVWAAMRATGGPHGTTIDLFDGRLARLGEGVVTDDLALAAGNGLWLAFIEEAYGAGTLGWVVRELGSGPAPAAFDRALERSAGESFDTALREFQLWSVLTGERSDGHHFSFAERLSGPVFAGSADGLPALSLQSDPAVKAGGGARVLLRPDGRDGGLRVLFEGDFSTPWQADVLLVGDAGSLRRLPVPVSAEGRGEIALPLQDVREAVLLVRNTGDDADRAHAYSWAADRIRGYPFELEAIEGRRTSNDGRNVMLSWETRSEQQLLGFNILRSEADAGRDGKPVKINPVWIPAFGAEAEPASYQFVDLSASPETDYTYRVEGVTLDGLSSLSDSVSVPASR